MKKLIYIVFAFIITSCLTNHEVDFDVPNVAPENLLYHRNDLTVAHNRSVQGDAPEVISQGTPTFDIESVAWFEDSVRIDVSDELNPFTIDIETGQLSLEPTDETALGKYHVNVMASNEYGTSTFEDAFRVMLVDKRPELSLETKKDSIIIFMDEAGTPLTTQLESISVMAEGVFMSDINVTTSPALPSATTITVDANGRFNIRGNLEEVDYEITISAENEYGASENNPSFTLYTKTLKIVERDMFVMNIEEGLKPDNQDEFIFAGMDFMKIEGPELPSGQTWWNIAIDRNNHPDADRKENFITRNYARNYDGISTAKHMIVSPSLSTEGMEVMTVDIGAMFNNITGVGGEQRIEARVVSESAYQEALTSGNINNVYENWTLAFNSADFQTDEKKLFIHNSSEHSNLFEGEDLRVVVVLVHGLTSAVNRGFMGIDELEIKGRFLEID
ncbi:hypothetical protein [Flammeovirga aprica]|uniref:Cadherin domain-containing protein n=1 Tax=Flammeovirga aprica JL-4 TaxID=694437 RepID=A0A7X9RXE5_9BACT|nr:hypothetical protein [Flammeovirga aprica]NME70359.1 hypothetical protein [Flammeovirga aprica JL-4]